MRDIHVAQKQPAEDLLAFKDLNCFSFLMQELFTYVTQLQG